VLDVAPVVLPAPVPLDEDALPVLPREPPLPTVPFDAQPDPSETAASAAMAPRAT
jgi:hypothetical protein